MKQLELDEVVRFDLTSRLKTLINYHNTSMRINGAPSESGRELALQLGKLAVSVLDNPDSGAEAVRAAGKAVEYLESNYHAEASEAWNQANQ